MSLARNTAKMAVLVILILSIYVNQNSALSRNEVKFPITSLKSEVSPVEPKTLTQFCSPDEYGTPIHDRFDAEVPRCEQKFIDEHLPQPKIHYREDAFKMPSICDYTEYIPEDIMSCQNRKDAFSITPYQRSFLKGHAPAEKNPSRQNYDNQYYLIPHLSIIDNPEINKGISLPQSWKYNEDTFKTTAPTKDKIFSEDSSIDVTRFQIDNTDSIQQEIPIKIPDLHSYNNQERPQQTIEKWLMNNPEEYKLHPELRNLYYKPEFNLPGNKAYSLSYFPATNGFIKINNNQKSIIKNKNGRINDRHPSYTKLKIEKGDDKPSCYITPKLTPNIFTEKKDSIQEIMVKNGPNVPFELNSGRLDKIDTINDKMPLKHSLTSSVSAVENRLRNSNIKRIFEEVGEVNRNDCKINNLNTQKIGNTRNELNDAKDKLDSSTASERYQQKCNGLKEDGNINCKGAMQSNPWSVESNKARYTYQNNIFGDKQSDEAQSEKLRSPLELTQSTLVSDYDYNNYKTKPCINKYNFSEKTLNNQHSLEQNKDNIQSIIHNDRNQSKLNECKNSEFHHRLLPSNNNLLVKNQQIYNTGQPDIAADDTPNLLGRFTNPFNYYKNEMEIHTDGVTSKNIQDTKDFNSSKDYKLIYKNPIIPRPYEVNHELNVFNDIRSTLDQNLKENIPYLNHEKKINTFQKKNILNTQNFIEIEDLHKKENINLSSNSKRTSYETFKKSPDIINNINVFCGPQPDLLKNAYVQVPQLTDNKNIPKTFTTTLDQVNYIDSGIGKIQSFDISRQSSPQEDGQAKNNKETQNNYYKPRGSDKEYNNKSLSNFIKGNDVSFNTDKNNYIKYYTLPTSLSSGKRNKEYENISNNTALNIIPVPIEPTVIQQPSTLAKPINNDNSPRVSIVPSYYTSVQAPTNSFAPFYETIQPKITILNPYSKGETLKYQQGHSFPLLYYVPSPTAPVLSQTEQITPNLKVLSQNYTLPNTIGVKTPQACSKGISTNPSHQDVIFSPNDKYTSLLSTSLNNIASVIVTNILSSLNTDISKALKKPITNQETLSTLASVSSGAPTIPAEIPFFEVTHPCIESPTFLPKTSVKLTKQDECANEMASSSKLSSKSKPYISTITINVLPSVQQSTKDIIILV